VHGLDQIAIVIPLDEVDAEGRHERLHVAEHVGVGVRYRQVEDVLRAP
jgi:hypothetical protein